MDISGVKQVGETHPKDLEDNTVSDDRDDLLVRSRAPRQGKDIVVNEGVSTGFHGSYGLFLRVGGFASAKGIRGGGTRGRSSRLPSGAFEGAKGLFFQKGGLEWSQKPSAELLLANALGRVGRAIQVGRVHMGKAHDVIPEITGQQLDLQLAVVCEIGIAGIASVAPVEDRGLVMLWGEITRVRSLAHVVSTLSMADEEEFHSDLGGDGGSS